MVEILRRGGWASADPDEVVRIDVRRHALCDFEVSLLMRSSASADAKRWRLQRLVYWNAGTAHMDTDLTEDTEKTIGNTVSWLAPTIEIDNAERLAIIVRSPKTESAFGTWILRVENLQRSVL
jgi:hypothetical protein